MLYVIDVAKSKAFYTTFLDAKVLPDYVSEGFTMLALPGSPPLALFVTRGVKWPRWPGHHVPTVFQIAFSRSNLASGLTTSQLLNAERALKADKIRSSNLYFRPSYAQVLHSRPGYTVLAQQQVSLNAPVYRPGYVALGGRE